MARLAAGMLLAGSALALLLGPKRAEAQDATPTPMALWDQFRSQQEPFSYSVVSDEIVESETDPTVRLRRALSS